MSRFLVGNLSPILSYHIFSRAKLLWKHWLTDFSPWFPSERALWPHCQPQPCWAPEPPWLAFAQPGFFFLLSVVFPKEELCSFGSSVLKSQSHGPLLLQASSHCLSTRPISISSLSSLLLSLQHGGYHLIMTTRQHVPKGENHVWTVISPVRIPSQPIFLDKYVREYSF